MRISWFFSCLSALTEEAFRPLRVLVILPLLQQWPLESRSGSWLQHVDISAVGHLEGHQQGCPKCCISQEDLQYLLPGASGNIWVMSYFFLRILLELWVDLQVFEDLWSDFQCCSCKCLRGGWSPGCPDNVMEVPVNVSFPLMGIGVFTLILSMAFCCYMWK